MGGIVKKFWILLPIMLVLTSCSPAAPALTETVVKSATQLQEPTTTEIIPTATEIPPTATTEPTVDIIPTATSVGQIFRDDFTGSLQPGWRWEKENPKKWSITKDGWLQIVGEDSSLVNNGTQNNLLWRDLPDGDFTIVVHLKAILTANFQQAAIFLYEDKDNYVSINRGYCDICSTGGQGIYMDYKVAGQIGTYSTKFTADDLYLKLESKNNVISGYFATSPDQWTRLGRFGNIFQFKNVGIGVSNCGSESTSNAVITGQYDYFEIMKP